MAQAWCIITTAAVLDDCTGYCLAQHALDVRHVNVPQLKLQVGTDCLVVTADLPAP